jgi:hypothetical protein
MADSQYHADTFAARSLAGGEKTYGRTTSLKYTILQDASKMAASQP